jgi:outer membrane protein TolC
LFFVGGPTFNWPLSNYGRIKNNVRVQDARLQQLLVNYQNTVLRAAQEAEDSMTGFLRSREEEGFRAQSETAAQRSVDLALTQYREGATDYTTVLNTQQTLVEQQDRLTGVRGNVAQSLIAMYKALGGGWQIRQGKEILPEQTKEQMSERTNWGDLLAPDLEMRTSPEDKPRTSPDW